MKLTVRKVDPSDPSRCRFDDARCLYAWSSYEIEVVAKDFADDLTSSCTLNLLHAMDGANAVMATCQLTADPFRRQTRTGVLVVGDSEHADLFDRLVASHSTDSGEFQYTDGNFTLQVLLGTASSTVLFATVPVTMGARVAVGGSTAVKVGATSGLWTQVEGGTVTSETSTYFTYDRNGDRAIALPLGDRTQTHFTIDLTTLSGQFNVVLVPTSGGSVVTTGLFEAYLAVTTVDRGECENVGSWASAGTTGKGGRRLGDILVGQTLPPSGTSDKTSSPYFDYDDSATLASGSHTFIIHLQRFPYASGWHVAFRVDDAVAAGIEADPEGNTVPGSGIN